MEKHSRCTASEFKKDISELCDKCPLAIPIKNAIENEVNALMREHKIILTPVQLQDYIAKEVTDSQGTMNKVFLLEQKKGNTDKLRHNRIDVYIWHKERIKALNRFLKPENDVKSSTRIMENNEKENRFWLTSFFNKQIESEYDYRILKDEIARNGYYVIKTTENDLIKIYNAHVAVILTSPKLVVENLVTKENVILDSIAYKKTFISSFNKGVKYFEKEHEVTTNVMYGDKSEQFINDLHNNYFHTEHYKIYKGWQFVKTAYPITLTHEEIEKHGFYSGIISKIHILTNKYPTQFEGFYDCKKETSSDIIPMLLDKKATTNNSENISLEKNQTKSEKLKIELEKYLFSDLNKVKILNEENRLKLIEKIATNKIPYAIAMLDYLGFLKFLEKEYFQIKIKLFEEISNWFDSDSRTIKGNVNSLNKISSENKTRYTAYKHKEKVIKDHEQLK